MYNSNENQSRKSIYTIIAVIFAVILVIITISVLIINFAPREEANIVNQTNNIVDDANSTANSSSDTQSSSLLSEDQLSMLKKELYDLLSNTVSANHDFDAAIRWDTIQTSQGTYPTISFLVDIDEYQQTFRATLDQDKVELRCPQLGETKYSESFCIGNTGDYDDSINVVFGDSLPHSGETSAGEYFSIRRNDIEDMENISDRYLIVMVRSCPWTDAALDRAREATNQFIESRGASPNLFDIRVEPAGGCHGE